MTEGQVLNPAVKLMYKNEEAAGKILQVLPLVRHSVVYQRDTGLLKRNCSVVTVQ